MNAITIYSKPNCSNCRLAKRFLSRLEADFVEVDISEDETALELVKSKGYKTLPVINKGDIWFSGFDAEKLEELV